MYVQKTDYKGRITIELLNLLIAEDEGNILAEASKIAEDTIASQVNVLYDVSGEFAKTGANRNYYLLTMAINIALYNIYQRADDEDIPKKVIKNHDDTMNDLALISKGKNTIDLPPRVNTDPAAPGNDPNNPIQGFGLRRWGSNPKRTHQI